jgi:membrane protein CcdC involved in cytochrome C biogenesis
LSIIGFPAMSLITSVAGFVAVMAWRIREGRTAVTVRKIVIPPLGMATGFCMFFVPIFRVPFLWALGAFLAGAIILAYPILRTSRLTLQGDTVMMRRSGAFFIVLVVLAAIRIAARSYLDSVITVEQSAALFFVLAFGMILRWRTSMLLEYRQLTSE